MVAKKNRRKEAKDNWEDSGTEGSGTNGSSSHATSKQVGPRAVSKERDNQGDNHANNCRRSRPEKKISSSQHQDGGTLGPWTQVVDDTVQSLADSGRVLSNLQKVFLTHKDGLDKMDEVNRRLHQLEEECEAKDEELKRQENTIHILRRIDLQVEEEKREWELKKEGERKEWELEKVKREKRLNLEIAEERLKMTRELERRKIEEEDTAAKRRQELEDDFAQKRDEVDRRVRVLEAEKARLSTDLENHQKIFESQTGELDEMKGNYDVLERAKDSFRKDMVDRQKELEEMKKEFALCPQPLDYLYVF
jgi:chromosome segregation ATPase